MSIQAFHLLSRAAEVDELARGGEQRVVEVHPEVSLRRLSGRPLPTERSADGRRELLAVLRTWLPDLRLPEPRPATATGRARPDDCLDSVAAAWSGERWRRGEAEVLGGEVDALGVPMRIVV